MTAPRAVIFGCAGPDLTADERAFFRDADPLGFILFARNVDTPERTCRLAEELRSCVARAEAPVLIDQEGGRVARLRPPHWRKAPPARLLGELYAPRSRARAWKRPGSIRACWRRMSRRSAATSIACPCSIIAFPETHAAIGDRAYADRPEPVAALGRAAAEGLLAEGVMPVIKHMPGHGRATVDSHASLPRVTAARDAAGTHRLPALPAARRPAVGDDRPPAVRGGRSRRRHHGIGTRREGDHPRPYRLRRPAAERRPLDAGAGRLPGRACRAGPGRRLRRRPSLQWRQMAEMADIAGRTGPLSAAAGRRFDAGRSFLARHRAPAGKAGLADAARRLAALLPEWG